MTGKLLLAALAAASSVCPCAFAQAPRAYVVRTGRPFRATIARELRKTGGLVSPAEVSVATKVAGRLASLERADGTRLEEGVKVRRGERIAVMESRDYKARLDVAAASVAAAEVTEKDARRELDRAEALFKEGTATEQERDQAETRHGRAIADLAQARARLELAEIELSETALYAPMDGVISRRSAEPGALLAVGAPVVTITKTDPLRFQLNVPTTLFAELSLGETGIRIDVDAYPGQTITGRVSRAYPVADEATRTIRVETLVANPDGRYLPGMYATATIDLNRRENVLVVPYDALVRDLGRHVAYRVVDGVAHAAEVKTGVRSGELVEVVEGLSDGDEIVTAGQGRLADGVRVVREKAAR